MNASPTSAPASPPAPAPTTSADPATWGLNHAHDPSIVRDDDGTYVMFTTDAYADGPAPAGAHMRTSTDLITWEWAGTALGEVPAPAREWSNAVGLWAPEVVRWPVGSSEQRWRMYYSASSFGSKTSAIGLATAPTAQGPWTDRGIVVRTEHETNTHNAIDAQVHWDEQGQPWFTYGSFFSGLYVLPLDRETGFTAIPGDLGTRIASRPRSVEGALEGPFLTSRPARCAGSSQNPLVLFVSFDSLINTYDVRVAHAPRPEGPYTDRDHSPMVSSTLDGASIVENPDHVGTLVLAGHHFGGQRPLIAPGHNSVFINDDGASFMVHHVRFGDQPRSHTAQIRRMFWLSSGWPVVSPQPYGGEPAAFDELGAHDVRPELEGAWDVVNFGWEPTYLAHEHLPESGAPVVPARTMHGDGTLAALGAFEGVLCQAVVPGAGEGADARTVPAFTGYARVERDGVTRTVAVFGVKHADAARDLEA